MANGAAGRDQLRSGGIGTTPHMAASCSCSTPAIRMTHVSYRGEAPAIADVLAGQVRWCRQRLGGDRR